MRPLLLFLAALLVGPLSADAVQLKRGDLIYIGGSGSDGLFRFDTATGHREMISGCIHYVNGICDDTLGTGPMWICFEQGGGGCYVAALSNGTIVLVSSSATAYMIDALTGDRSIFANPEDGNGPRLWTSAMEVIEYLPPINVSSIGGWGAAILCLG